MQKKYQIMAIILLLVVVTISVATTYLIKWKKQANLTPSNSNQELTKDVSSIKAQVIYLTGRAWQQVDGRLIEIKENDTLEEGNEIITDAETRLVLSFDDGSILRLGDNSKITLSQLQAQSMNIKEDQGIVFARVNKDANHSFIIKAGDYEIKSLGTVFSVENKDEVKVAVYESKVEIQKDDQILDTVKADQEWLEKEDKVTKIKETNEFIAWSLKEEGIEKEDLEVKTTESSNETSPSDAVLSLSASATESGVQLKWTVNGEVSNGVKLVKSLSANPVFPGDNYIYLSNPSTRSYHWEIADGQVWHFRVCQYSGDGQCLAYSNDVSVQTPKKSLTESKENNSQSGEVKSISIKVEKAGDKKVKVTWNVDGYSKNGFKVVWSENSNPTYPCRENDEYHYLSDPNTREDYVSLSSGKTYHFRVCEYLGGKCGVYSSDVSVSL